MQEIIAAKIDNGIAIRPSESNANDFHIRTLQVAPVTTTLILA
jgi:hypothetical protein